MKMDVLQTGPIPPIVEPIFDELGESRWSRELIRDDLEGETHTHLGRQRRDFFNHSPRGIRVIVVGGRLAPLPRPRETRPRPSPGRFLRAVSYPCEGLPRRRGGWPQQPYHRRPADQPPACDRTKALRSVLL